MTTPPRLRVFVADDHPIVRSGLLSLIAAQPDMEVVGEAADGRSAVQGVKELRPDVVVIDVAMPIFSGIRATEEMRRGDGANVKVLALSAYEDRGYAQQMLAAGATGYVVKRAAPEELLRAIWAVAGGHVYLDAVMARSLATSWSPVASGQSELSERELGVLRQLARGQAVKTIAAEINVSPRTVETYRTRAMTKLGLKSRADIVRYAARQGWLEES